MVAQHKPGPLDERFQAIDRKYEALDEQLLRLGLTALQRRLMLHIAERGRQIGESSTLTISVASLARVCRVASRTLLYARDELGQWELLHWSAPESGERTLTYVVNWQAIWSAKPIRDLDYDFEAEFAARVAAQYQLNLNRSDFAKNTAHHDADDDAADHARHHATDDATDHALPVLNTGHTNTGNTGPGVLKNADERTGRSRAGQPPDLDVTTIEPQRLREIVRNSDHKALQTLYESAVDRGLILDSEQSPLQFYAACRDVQTAKNPAAALLSRLRRGQIATSKDRQDSVEFARRIIQKLQGRVAGPRTADLSLADRPTDRTAQIAALRAMTARQLTGR